MMTAFRRFASSPLGMAVFAIILIAFVVTLYEGKSGFNGALDGSGGALATVGGQSIGEAEAIRRTQTQLESARQQSPELDMTAFVAQGGAEKTIEQMVNGRALELFAADQGLVASRRLVDGAIASIPAFNGPDGKFDRNTFLAMLAQRKIPENQLREDFAREAITKALLIPVAGSASMPAGLASPYATLMLEARSGQIGVVPTQAFLSKTPIPDAELKTFYEHNIARYTVPERRVIKYATFDRTRFEGKVAPTEAEIAAAYKADAAKYAASEKRGFTQIIVQKQSDAESLLAKIKSGTAMAAAAQSLGLEALTVAATDKTAFEKLTGPRVAEAAFAAAKGSIAPLAQSGLGYHIVRVDSVTGIAARSLDSARAEITTELTKTKIDAALSDLVGKIGDEIDSGATFDDVVKKFELTATATPPITAAGLAPEVQGFVLPEPVKPLLRDAFQAETGDDPQVSSVGNGTAFVFYHMDSVVPSAPKPLAAIAPQVLADAQIDRAGKAAKKVADSIVTNINKGMPFAQALAGAGVALPAPKPAGGRRLELAQAQDKAPPPLMLMFGMAEKKAKTLAVPQGAGWFIVYLDKIVPGDAKAAAPLMAGTQAQLSRVLGDEYVTQFANAVKAEVGVKKNDSAIAAFKRTLTGGR